MQVLYQPEAKPAGAAKITRTIDCIHYLERLKQFQGQNPYCGWKLKLGLMFFSILRG
jgi:hypothetical protein